MKTTANDKHRPLKYPKTLGQILALGPRFSTREIERTTDAGCTWTLEILRRGETVASVSLRDAADAMALTRGRTALLEELVCRDGESLAALLYVAARRARILGMRAMAFAWSEKDAGDSVAARSAALLDARVAGQLRAQRIDVAALRATEALAPDDAIAPAIFAAEVVETLERWISTTLDRGFFRAVFDGVLTREQHAYTLTNMHHFVRWTTRLLGHAVAASNDPRLRDHYLGHLSGEINHEIIIERDLTALGEDAAFSTGSTVPDTGTRLFMAVQESLIGFHRDPVLFMASPLAAEGLASHLTPRFVERLTACAASWGVQDPARVITFFTSHVSTDGGEDGHWETTVSLLAEHLRSERDVQRFVGTMRASMKGLSLLYEAAIDDLEIFAAGAQVSGALRAPG